MEKRLSRKDVELSVFAFTAFILIGFMFIPVMG